MRKSPKKPDAPDLRAIPYTPARAGFQFTPAEMRLILAYRKFDDDSQEFWLDGMEVCAKDEGCGLRAKNPGLRLIAGGKTQ